MEEIPGALQSYQINVLQKSRPYTLDLNSVDEVLAACWESGVTVLFASVKNPDTSRQTSFRIGINGIHGFVRSRLKGLAPDSEKGVRDQRIARCCKDLRSSGSRR